VNGHFSVFNSTTNFCPVLNLLTLAGEWPLFGFNISSFFNLQTLAGVWPLFGFYKKWPLTC
jgi:hypothetical protein